MTVCNEESRLVYTKPTLEELGSVKVMTLAGSAGSSESQPGSESGMACEPQFMLSPGCGNAP